MNRILLALALATILAAPAAASSGKTELLRGQHTSQRHGTITERAQAPVDDWMPCDYYHIDVPGNCA